MSKKNIVFIGIAIIVVFAAFFSYLDHIQQEKEELEKAVYVKEAVSMQKNVAAMVDEKKKATTAIALTLAASSMIANHIDNRAFLEQRIEKLIHNFKANTNYKNIWIHILDKDKRTIYRSWTTNLFNVEMDQRADLEYVYTKKKIFSGVGVDSFSMNFKAIVPIYDHEENFVGVLEVISHFNSIEKGLKKLGIDSIVLVDPHYAKDILYPYSNLFIEDFYVADFHPNKALIEYLKKKDLRKCCKEAIAIGPTYIIASYPIEGINKKVLGYYLLFKKRVNVSKTGIDYFVFKWSAIAVLLLMALAGIVNIVLYISLRQQKLYYKKILDSSSNIVLVNDKKNIIDANKTFFSYFTKYKTIEDFRAANTCICRFFVEEDGYLSRGSKEYSWLDYMVANQNKLHKVKMKIENKIYYFMVYVSLISEEKEHYSVIFSDITEQEIYKKDLEKLSMHDPLTGIGNRRKYQARIEEEIARSCRYKTALSIISFDLDFFKSVNDTYGHLVGDKVLVEYTKLVNDKLRDVDELFRTGGEEFIIIAPHTTREEAEKLANKLRKLISEHKKIVAITASFGVVGYKACESEESLYRRADEALYAAKESGRNRVVVR